MKPVQEERVYEEFGNNQSKKTQFKIQQSKEAFKILSSGVYSDKVLAVIREYSANAWDSHRMAKKGHVPFEVHLPNTFEPWFSVKDFGLGLSHENILELFTTYFSSSKREDNEATGFLGIGSKSAFAYTDQFTVTSWFNGEKKVYSCFISDSGEPEVSLVSTTKEEYKDPNGDVSNGLEIKLAVDPKDFNEFKVKAAGLFRFYKTPPKVLGNAAYGFEKIEVEKEIKLSCGGLFTLTKHTIYSSYSSGVYIVQGACSYPIASTHFTTPTQSLLRYLKGILEVPIGTVNIVASREHIEYDKHTISSLEKMLSEISTIILADIGKEISDIKTEWQAQVFAVKSQTHPLWSIFHHKQVLGKSLYDWARHNFSVSFKELNLKKDVKDHAGNSILYSKGQNERLFYENFATVLSYSQYDLANVRPKSYPVGAEFHINVREPNVKLVVEDVVKRKTTEIIKHNYVNKADKVYLIKPHGPENLSKVLKALDFIEDKSRIALLSSLPEPAVVPKVKSAPIISIFSHNGRGWNAATKDPTTGGIYVDLHKYTPEKYLNNANCSRLISLARDAGIISNTTIIYGIPKTFKAIPKKNPGWVELSDELVKEVLARLKGINIKAEYEKKQSKEYAMSNATALKFNTMFPNASKYMDKHVKDLDKFKAIPDDKLWKVIETLKELKELNLIETKAFDQGFSELTNLEKQSNFIKQRYPLLFHYVPRPYDAKEILTAWREYIEAIDKFKP